MLISREYADLNTQLHQSRPDYGTSGRQWASKVADLAGQVGAATILDYGCGKQTLAAALPGLRVIGYDPAVPGLDAPPVPADLVVCTDVLEHVEPSFIDGVLDDLCRVTSKAAFVTVATRPAVKTLADGRNAHLTVQPLAWWRASFESRFDIVEVRELEGFEFSLVLKALHADIELIPSAPASPAADPSTSRATAQDADRATGILKYKSHRLIFNTPNKMTNWRVQSLFDKEPDTIRWIEAMTPGSVLVDVGANVGMYTVFSAVTRQVKVYAFEPESQNYSLLNQNIASNALSDSVIAYPLALSDETGANRLYLSQFTAGGSCHSFGEDVGFDLRPRGHAFAQGSFCTTLDQLVKNGTVPVPDYIKLDVDGFEHKVIEGARETLKNLKVKEILVELNTHLPEHNAVIDRLSALGFTHDPEQVKGALRKSGAFEGVGEFIFRRGISTAASINFARTFTIVPPRTNDGWHVLQHVLDRVARAELVSEPFPYLVVDDVFPADYYAQLLANFPTSESLLPLGQSGRVPSDAYKDRHVVLFNDDDFARLLPERRTFWESMAQWMYSDPFVNAFVTKFAAALQPRLSKIMAAEGSIRSRGDALLVADHTRYAIGPHTDAPHRLVSFLFYLPQDDSMRELGTSIYRPKDPNFVCWGGPHHPFEPFERVRTVDFLPNRLVAFPKTERSFHGVEAITRENVSRHLLINNIRLLNSVTH
jgi:FkbM family methyltransferase